jgi:hypothetical protein
LLIAYLKECRLLYPLWIEDVTAYKKPNTLIYFPSSRKKCNITYKKECTQNGEPEDILYAQNHKINIPTSNNKPCNCQNK